MPLASFAKTSALADKYSAISYAPLGASGLIVSQAGFGCYRVTNKSDDHRAALKKALLAGVNLIDTSSNYTDGESEALVGEVLAELASDHGLERESLVVVTKGGYLQGLNYELSQDRKKEGRPFAELVEYSEGLEHCIHPEFLADQITRSLQRLSLDAVDVYLLHNPEYYLAWAAKQGMALEEARTEFHARMARAFAHLEQEVQKGRIGCYGVSANTFVEPAGQEDFVSLSRLWEIAQDIGDEHHFKVIELPLNLLEPAAMTRANQPDGKGVLAKAMELGLGVLTNRPLNALGADGLLRLAEDTVADPPQPAQVMQYLKDLQGSEDQLRVNVVPNLHMPDNEREELADFLVAAEPLTRSWQELSGPEHWHAVQAQYFVPRINAALGYISQKLEDSREGQSAIKDHAERVMRAFGAIGAYHAAQARQRALGVKERVAALDRDWAQAPVLSLMAVRAVRGAPGVSAVLVGMRSPRYVDDVLAELARPAPGVESAQAWFNLAGTL